jgi:hypothetical protein
MPDGNGPIIAGAMTAASSALGRRDRGIQVQIPLRFRRGLAEKFFQALQHRSLFRGSRALRPNMATVDPMADFFCY